MPRLSRRVKSLLAKSRDSAMLAVDVYNKPVTEFRSSNFVGMMLAAWTPLFHAIFEKRGVKYYQRLPGSNNYVYVNGERQPWDLAACLEHFYSTEHPPARQNIVFFIGLRSHIEQHYLPVLDLEIHGECQSLLLNYEKLITQEFGADYGLSTSLAIPLRLLSGSTDWQADSLQQSQSRDYQTVKTYLETYRGSLDVNTRHNAEFCFRVFLVPKIGEGLGDVAVEFVRYDPSRPEEMEKYKKLVAFIVQEKQVAVVNPGRLKPRDVAQRVQTALGIPFRTSFQHVTCWRYYRVRPENNSPQPGETDTRYCHYDAAHNDYVYTEEWVEFLIAELSNPAKRRQVLGE